MRVVLDTNILISALMTYGTPPDRLYEAWRNGFYTLLTSEDQLDEVRRVTRRNRFKARITPSGAGRMVNDLRTLASVVSVLPDVDVSRDPFDNHLLALVEAGKADLLVTGDKRDLLSLKKYKRARIVTAREALVMLRES